MSSLKMGDIALRLLTLSDVPRLAQIANNEKISRNLRDGFPHPYTLSHATKFITMCMEQKPTQVFAIEYMGEYVGNIGIHKCNDVYQKSAEIGYFLGESYWNKGIMQRAIKLACSYGFSDLDIVRIHTGVFDFNKASQRVLEKSGFTMEGIFRKAVYKNGKFHDEVRYALITE